MSFSGFLSTQIIWDNFNLNAQQVQADKQKYSLYEAAFQTLVLKEDAKTSIELKNLPEPIILVNFWASWCLPCLKEFPSLVKFQEKYQGKVRVIGINGDEENAEAEMKKVNKKYKLNFKSYLDPVSIIADQFLVNTYPVSIVFYKGKVIYLSKKIHDFMADDFIKLIDTHLKDN